MWRWVSTLAPSYTAAWTERDEVERLRLLETACTEDVTFLPEDGNAVHGRAALATLIANFLTSWPADQTLRMEAMSSVSSHNWIRAGFAWRLPGEQVHFGTKVVEVRDGRMATILVFSDPPPPPVKAEADQLVVRRYYEEVCNGRDLDLNDQLVGPGFVDHTPLFPDPPRGGAATAQTLRTLWRAFPDLRFTVEEQSVVGEWVLTRLKVAGTHEGELLGLGPTGKRVVVVTGTEGRE